LNSEKRKKNETAKFELQKAGHYFGLLLIVWAFEQLFDFPENIEVYVETSEY
jgi:hypothetical protein